MISLTCRDREELMPTHLSLEAPVHQASLKKIAIFDMQELYISTLGLWSSAIKTLQFALKLASLSPG